MNTTHFEKAAHFQPDRAPREPQDHGPLTDAELHQRMDQLRSTQAIAQAYQSLCDRKPFEPKI